MNKKYEENTQKNLKGSMPNMKAGASEKPVKNEKPMNAQGPSDAQQKWAKTPKKEKNK